MNGRFVYAADLSFYSRENRCKDKWRGKRKKKKVEYGIRPGAFQNIHFLYKLTPKLTTLSHFITAAVTET